MKTQSTKRIEKLASILLLMLFVGAFPIMPPQEISLEPVGGSLANTLVNVTHYLVLSIFLVRYCNEKYRSTIATRFNSDMCFIVC